MRALTVAVVLTCSALAHADEGVELEVNPFKKPRLSLDLGLRLPSTPDGVSGLVVGVQLTRPILDSWFLIRIEAAGLSLDDHATPIELRAVFGMGRHLGSWIDVSLDAGVSQRFADGEAGPAQLTIGTNLGLPLLRGDGWSLGPSITTHLTDTPEGIKGEIFWGVSLSGSL